MVLFRGTTIQNPFQRTVIDASLCEGFVSGRVAYGKLCKASTAIFKRFARVGSDGSGRSLLSSCARHAVEGKKGTLCFLPVLCGAMEDSHRM